MATRNLYAATVSVYQQLIPLRDAMKNLEPPEGGPADYTQDPVPQPVILTLEDDEEDEVKVWFGPAGVAPDDFDGVVVPLTTSNDLGEIEPMMKNVAGGMTGSTVDMGDLVFGVSSAS